jgi:F0F1-type ATP synthase epsilon subunit
VLPHRVIVLAETCEKSAEIDVERAKQRIAELEEQLRNAPMTDPEVVRMKLLKHTARLSAVNWKL